VFPSLYEGFGLPILEAMACGTPVVCSATTSLPEVAGDAAQLIDPTDVQSIGDGLIDVLRNDSLAAHLRARGLDRARTFSWTRTANDTERVYRSLLSSSITYAGTMS